MLLNGSGAELARYAFTPDQGAGGDPQRNVSLLFINELVPYVPGTTEVEILGPGGMVLGSIAAGAHIPAVQLVPTERGVAAVRSDVLAADTITLTWTASDADPGDTLTFNVQYSADGGSTWETIEQNLTNSSVEIAKNNLTRSDQAFFRVVATDSIHSSTSAFSEAFIVPNHPPTVRIVVKWPGPAPTPPIPVVQELIPSPVCAQASDPDGDSVEFDWTADGVALADHGDCPDLSSLRACDVHHVTVTAHDAKGASAPPDGVDVEVWCFGKDNCCPLKQIVVAPKIITCDPGQGHLREGIDIDNIDSNTSISWSIASISKSWLTPSKMSGPTTPDTVSLNCDRSGIPAATRDSAAVVFSGAGRTATVQVNLIVPCVGDCNEDGQVTVNEIITMANIALGNADISTCFAGDEDGDGEIRISEIITAVNYALNGCE